MSEPIPDEWLRRVVAGDSYSVPYVADVCRELLAAREALRAARMSTLQEVHAVCRKIVQAHHDTAKACTSADAGYSAMDKRAGAFDCAQAVLGLINVMYAADLAALEALPTPAARVP